MTRGLGGGLRRVLRDRPGQPRWRTSFIAQSSSWAQAPLLNGSTALSGAAPGPQRAQSRTTAQRARTLGIAAGFGHIGNLQSAVLLYSQYCQHSIMVGLTLEVSTAPTRLWQAPGSRRDLVGPLRWATQPNDCPNHSHKQPQGAP